MEFPSSHQLNQFISDLRVYEWFTQILIEHYKANSGDPDQTPRFAASDLGRHYFPMSHEKDVKLI